MTFEKICLTLLVIATYYNLYLVIKDRNKW